MTIVQWLVKVFIPWHFSYFVALHPGYKIDFWVVWIFWFTQHAYHFEDAKYFFIVNQTRNKTKKLNLSLHNYLWYDLKSAVYQRNFVEPPFAAITAASVLVYVSISLAHLATGNFAHSSWRNCSSPIKLNVFRWYTAIFKSYHKFSFGFSGLWLDHFKTL